MSEYVEAAMNARIGELQATLEDVMIHMRDFVEWLGPCDHVVGSCKCEIIDALEKAEKVLE